MAENEKNLCRFPYLDNANFQPSKMKLVLEKNGIVPINYSYKIQINGHFNGRRPILTKVDGPPRLPPYALHKIKTFD